MNIDWGIVAALVTAVFIGLILGFSEWFERNQGAAIAASLIWVVVAFFCFVQAVKDPK
jgi:hypothetical protein